MAGKDCSPSSGSGREEMANCVCKGWDESVVEHLPSMLEVEVSPQHWEGQTRHSKFSSDKPQFCLFFLLVPKGWLLLAT